MWPGELVQRDDLQEIANLLRSCDVVALAAPPTGPMCPAPVKNLFDRLLGVAMEENGRLPKPRLSKDQRYLPSDRLQHPFSFSRLFGQSAGALRAMNEFFPLQRNASPGPRDLRWGRRIGSSAEAGEKKIRGYWEKMKTAPAWQSKWGPNVAAKTWRPQRGAYHVQADRVEPAVSADRVCQPSPLTVSAIHVRRPCLPAESANRVQPAESADCVCRPYLSTVPTQPVPTSHPGPASPSPCLFSFS